MKGGIVRGGNKVGKWKKKNWDDLWRYESKTKQQIGLNSIRGEWSDKNTFMV